MLSHTHMFNGFIDSLKLPVVRATLASLPHNSERRRDALIRTVELFAYGTVGEYYDLISPAADAEPGDNKAVWTLNDVMLEKLRMLTVVSVVSRRVSEEEAEGGGRDLEINVEMKMADAALSERSQTKKKQNGSRRKSTARAAETMLSIPYSRLASELRMPYRDNGMTNDDGGGNDTIQETRRIRQLEDLLIKCIYSNIISAKLDQMTQSLIVQPHKMLVTPDFVGWEAFFSASSSAEGVDEGEAGTGSGVSSSVGVEEGKKGVYGSILSRDLRTITPESTTAEITRMSSSLQHFLSRSNILLETLERTSNTTVVKHRKADEGRWTEVRKVVEEAPSRMRDMASPSTQSSAFATSSSSSSHAPGASERGMRVGWGMGRGGSASGFPESGEGVGGQNLMEVGDSRRQVKRSKGGHSMVLGSGGV